MPDLDLSLLNEIADGSDEFIVESITMFLQQSPELIQTIGEAITAQDWATAASAAHKLKSNLGFFGMLNSQALLQQVELACKTGKPDVNEVTTNFNQLKDTVTANLITLAQIKDEKEAGL